MPGEPRLPETQIMCITLCMFICLLVLFPFLCTLSLSLSLFYLFNSPSGSPPPPPLFLYCILRQLLLLSSLPLSFTQSSTLSPLLFFYPHFSSSIFAFLSPLNSYHLLFLFLFLFLFQYLQLILTLFLFLFP